MKKILGFLLAILLLVGCSSPTPNTTTDETGTETPETSETNESGSTVIDVFTRDASSGTREAFEAGIGLEEGQLTVDAVETSGNGDMAGQVGRDDKAIGYVSLTTDFEGNNLKPFSFEGVEATIDNVLDKSYTLSRPFSYTTRASGDFSSTEVEEAVVAFLDYLHNSVEGLEAVEAAGGIVDKSQAKSWSELSAAHSILDGDTSSITIHTAGSTSVEKTLQAALEGFQAETGINFQMSHTGSGDGWKRVLGGEKDGANYADIGFASRDFKTDGSEDTSSALETSYYCLDAVVVVTSSDNSKAPENLTAQQVVDVFSGTVKNWEDIK